MRILQINTIYAAKSTGRTCSEVEQALLAGGHECCTAYGHGPLYPGNNAYRINTPFEYMLHNLLSRLTGWEGYFSYFATRRLIRFIKSYRPDVIHLRNLHGHYLHLPTLFRYLAEADIPIVQNLHDCWAFTGKCAYYTTIGCNKWQTACGNCPKVREYPQSYFFDHTRAMREDKERWYRALKSLTVVGVSRWVADEAKASLLRCASTITHIYNWINLDVFKPHGDRNAVRRKYNIPTDKFVIIGVSSQWPHQSPRYEDFYALSQKLGEDEVIVMVGNCEPNPKETNILHIPFVSSTKELAELYSCADVYVHCSIEDTFGKVIAEAMACGTPAIVYAITGCAELVTDGCGYLVEPRNVEAVRAHLTTIKRQGKAAYTAACLENVRARFDFSTNSAQLIQLYEKLAAAKATEASTPSHEH